jgi:hypothetical protein
MKLGSIGPARRARKIKEGDATGGQNEPAGLLQILDQFAHTPLVEGGVFITWEARHG